MKISCIYRSLLCPGESIGQENIGRGRLIGLRARWQSQAAGILLARGVDDLERLVGGRHRRAEIEYVLLALRFAGCLHGEGIGLLDELMVPGAEVGFAALQDVELRTLLEEIGRASCREIVCQYV